MAAIGPDTKAGFIDPAPVSNADWANTLAHILSLQLSTNGHLVGRVMSEAALCRRRRAAEVADDQPAPRAPAANGFMTVLNAQEAAGETYFDAAGMPGRTLGLKP